MRNHVLLWIAALTLLSPAALADTVDALRAARERPWAVGVPIWVPGFRGEFAVGDIVIDGESSGGSGIFDRWFDSKLRLNYFFMGAAAFQKNRWRFHGDVFGGAFTDDVIFKLTDGTVASAKIQPIIPRLHASYRVFQRHWGDSHQGRMRVAVLGGLRYYDLTIKTEVLNQSGGVKTNWLDPILGIWVPVDLSHRWKVEAMADMGGFSAGSRLSWQLMASATYYFSPLVGVSLGYVVLDVDYRGQVNSQSLLFKARVGGPAAGIRFRF